MLVIGFWFTFVILIYVYFGYPVITLLWGSFLNRRTQQNDNYQPSMALVISAYNEAAVIGEKVQNALQLDYPMEKLDIWVVSDASDDGTDEIVKGFKQANVHLYRPPERKGKTYGISMVMDKIDADIVVFSDANAMYRSDALRQLAAPFADPQVGYVVGFAKYYKDSQSRAGRHEDQYWSFEVRLKIYESRLGSVVGGDGAIYAIRRELYYPLAPDDINDFVNPIHIILQGYRGIFQPAAVCYEHTADTFSKEYQRKRRIVNRSWRGLWKNAAVLNPFKTGLFAWQLISHKLLRWVGGLFVLVLFIANAFLFNSGAFYQILLFVQIGFYLLALAGYLFDSRSRKAPILLELPYYFVLVNIASLQGIVDAFRGETYTTWRTIRQEKDKMREKSHGL